MQMCSPSWVLPPIPPTTPRTAPGVINRINLVHSLLAAFREPFRGVSTKHLSAYLACFKWRCTFMATDSSTTESTVVRQTRQRDLTHAHPRDVQRPPFQMDYWGTAA